MLGSIYHMTLKILNNCSFGVKTSRVSLILRNVIMDVMITFFTVTLLSILLHGVIIPTQCFYRFFGDFDWSVGKIKLFLHFDKNPCVGIFDNCLDFTVLDCVDINELYRKLNYFYQIKYS